MSGPSGNQGPTEPGFINGGMMQRQEPFTARNIVIDVDNLEDALQAVNEAGGSTVAERQAVGDTRFTAYFKDSEGNRCQSGRLQAKRSPVGAERGCLLPRTPPSRARRGVPNQARWLCQTHRP